MKSLNTSLIVAHIAASAMLLGAQARPLVEYASGVQPQNGANGAANPTSQGWTASGFSNIWADGFDSGNGGWRTVDGTSGSSANYRHVLSTDDRTAMSTDGWTLTATLALDANATNSAGDVVVNYYAPPNHTRQNNMQVIVEVAGQYQYFLTFNIDANSELYLNDGTTNHTITTDGSAYDNFKSLQLDYSNTGAILRINGLSLAITSNGLGSQNRVVFGASSASGQGSAIWNNVTLESFTLSPGTVLILD